jgi:hypothetical protein
MLKQGLEQVLKGAELLLTQFAAFTDNFCRLPLSPKPQYLETELQFPFFCMQQCRVQRYRALALLSRSSDSMAKQQVLNLRTLPYLWVQPSRRDG